MAVWSSQQAVQIYTAAVYVDDVPMRYATFYCIVLQFTTSIKMLHTDIIQRNKTRCKFKITHFYNVRRSYVTNNEGLFSDLGKC